MHYHPGLTSLAIDINRWQESLPKDSLRLLDDLDVEYLTTWAPIVEEDS